MQTWWKQTRPAHHAAAILVALAAIGILVLLVTPKPWQWDLPEGRKMRIVDCVRIYSWWAGAANVLLMFALAATARWWMRPSQGGLYHLPRPPMPKWFPPLTILAMIVCAVFGAQRLRQSFWDDEVYAMRRAIHGQWKRNDDGSIKFRTVTWQETFWFFEKPQHQLHSIITRVVLDSWRTVAKPMGLGIREDIARIPSYLAGILSVGAMALLLWRLGFPAAGVVAAFLLVIHPWHIRYASELRAYSFMLCILPLCYVFLIEALDIGRWRWWSAFGASLFILMYSNALNIYPAAGLGLCGLAAIALRWRHPEARIQMCRFCVMTLLAGMAFLQLMLPCLPQFIEYQNTTAVQGPMDRRWLLSYLGLLFAGAPWSSTGQAVSKYMELYPWASSHPIPFAALAGSALALFAFGTLRLLAGGPVQRLVALALLLPAPIAFVISKACQHHLFEWYLLFLLPGFVAAIALGLDGARRALARNRTGAVAGILLIAALLCAYAAFTTPQRNWLLNRPLQQIRESAEATRPVLDPFAPENKEILTASFIGPPDPYDANIIPFRSVRELSALIGRADEQGKVLFVNFGFLTTAQLRFRPILNALGDSSLFEKTAELQGFDPINDRFVYRYKPQSAADRDLVAEFQPDQEQEEKLPGSQ
ncbi:MAG: glycosyltransferase family 39 protein [Terrimicrobiaceae bacterium]